MRAVMNEDKPEGIWRRFMPIGTKEEMDRFGALIEEKNLSREDVRIILRAVRLNPNTLW